MRRDKILWVLLAIGAALRFWKIEGDLPYVFHYDEPTLIDNAVWMLQHQTLNPHFFNYPTGLIYLLAALFGIVLLCGRLFSIFATGAAAVSWLTTGTYPRPPEGGVLYFYPTVGVPALYLIGRTISAVAGVATIALVYAVARRCDDNRGTARLAALFLALSPLAVDHAHVITTDTAATAMATWALLAATCARDGGTRGWILAGVLAGLAAGIKYNAGLVVLALPLLAVWCWRAERARAIRSLAVAGVATVLTFLLTTPFALFDSAAFFRDLAHEFHRVASVTTAFQGAEAVGTTAVEKVGAILWHNVGLLALLAAAWGAVTAVRVRRYAGVAVLVWIAAFMLPQFRWERIYPRYLVPIMPALLLLAGWGVSDLAGRIAPALPRLGSAARYVIVAFAVVVLATPTVRLLERESQRARPDPRIEMTAWIEANIPAGEKIVLEGRGPFPGPGRYTLQYVDFLGRSKPEEYRARGVRYLIGTGWESRVEGEQAFQEVFENLHAIQAQSSCLWRSGRLAVYRLGGEPSWEAPVQRALSGRDFRGARTILERAVSSGDTTAYAWKTLGSMCAFDGDTLAAIEALLRAAEKDTTDVEVPLALNNIYLQRGEWDEALAQLFRAQSLAPRDPLVSSNLAVAYLYRAQSRFRNGDPDGALEDWSAARANAATAVKFSPGDPNMVKTAEQVERMGQKWGFGKPR